MDKECSNCKYDELSGSSEPCRSCRNSRIIGTSEYKRTSLLWEPKEENIVNRPTIKRIRELTKSEVFPALMDNESVLRINLEKMIVCDLENKSISTIRNDLKKDCYIYLVVEEWRESL